MARIKLYETFKHWQDKGVIWLFSDPHFDDPDCKIMNENWPSPEEQVKLINGKVGKNDTLVILGDIGNQEWVKKLKGRYKVLFTGNHDKGASIYKKKYYIQTKDGRQTYTDVLDIFTIGEFDTRKEAEELLTGLTTENPLCRFWIDTNNLFDEVYEGPLFINSKILLSHEPIEIGFGFNIHGHVHNGYKIEQDDNYKEDFAVINVCCDVRDFVPVRLDELLKDIKAKDLHRITIDCATERKTM